MRFNLEYNVAGQARLARIMRHEHQWVDDRDAALAAAGMVAATYAEAGMPSRLSVVGVDEDDIKIIAQDAMTDFGLHRNVRPVQNSAELEALLREMW